MPRMLDVSVNIATSMVRNRVWTFFSTFTHIFGSCSPHGSHSSSQSPTGHPQCLVSRAMPNKLSDGVCQN